MPIYEIETDGKTYEVDAPDMKAAVPQARLFAARSRMTAQATEGAVARSAGPRTDASRLSMLRGVQATAGSFGHTPQPEEMPEGADAKIGMAASIASLPLIPLGGSAVAGGVRALQGLSGAERSLALSKTAWTLAKAGTGFYAADKVLEGMGVPPGTRSAVLLAAGFQKPGEAARKALSELVSGARAAAPIAREAAAVAAPTADKAKAAWIAASRARREAAAAETVAKARTPVAVPVEPPPPTAPTATPAAAPYPTQPSPEYTEMVRQDLAARRARLAEYDQRVAAERAALDPQFIADDAVSVVPPREVPMIPDEAVSLVAEPIPPRVRRQPVQGIVIQPPAPRGAPQAPPQATVQAKGTTTMATNLGGTAKAGPPPTPPDKLEEALRASLKEVEESGLKVPRVQVGAERVGRQVGMTKEAVRQETGPILNEERGQASPIFPMKALESIVDKIRTIPMAEREAYVRAATSDKAMWQVETIRRTLERVGLLVPVGGLSLAQLMDREK